jgi:hypothetical protein
LKRELKRIFGHNREEVTGGWRTLHNEELGNLFLKGDQIKMDEMARTCGTHEIYEKT